MVRVNYCANGLRYLTTKIYIQINGASCYCVNPTIEIVAHADILQYQLKQYC